MSKDVVFTPDQGFLASVDIKEDEEQNVKLQQTIELLLTAGYFRARIKGLSPFDKVVGGMTWCITTCSYDIDVDLLFQENLAIGQKIALTEKIVAVLPRMKCPHQIEPHQIQGLDFIHIFPVVQWLVKKAIETREEMGDQIRAYAISQFDKSYTMPEDLEFRERKQGTIDVLAKVKDIYGPKRKYKRHDKAALLDERSRVHSTLLEYGVKTGIIRSRDENSAGKASTAKMEKIEKDEAEMLREEEEQIASLLSGMQVTDKPGNRVTASAVGSIVGMQSDEIQAVAGKYAEKQAELLSREQESPRMSGAHQHTRMKNALQKQIEQQEKKLLDLQKTYDELKSTVDDVQARLEQAESLNERIQVEMKKLEEMETDENRDILGQLIDLVALNESLKKQEQDFRNHCKEEMDRFQGELEKARKHANVDDTDDEQMKLIAAQFNADMEKMSKIKMVLARKNREISALTRKIDEAPTRSELSQYQRRFIELYNQVATKHKETKQFFTLYNTLDDTKLYLDKEVNLLNSIFETFEQAMASPGAKEQFLKQFEQIVEGVKNNYNKLEKKKQEEKMHRDRLNDEYLKYVEEQRIYYKTVKDFQDECRKNEILLAKLE